MLEVQARGVTQSVINLIQAQVSRINEEECNYTPLHILLREMRVKELHFYDMQREVSRGCVDSDMEVNGTVLLMSTTGYVEMRRANDE